jgi:predicted outer membrane repeat protein
MLASRPRWLAAGAALLTLSWTLTVSATVCYVNGAASGANTGASWTAAYTDLQSALNNASCTEVWVAQGVYKPAASNTAVSFIIGPNVAVYGGFSGSETSRDARNPVAHVTTLSGAISGGNSQHNVVMDGTASTPITATTVLDGFTLTGGYNANSQGGALWCKGNGAGHACSPTLANLVFSGNHAGNGGAMELDGYSGGASNPTLTNITFSSNSATTFGGAMYCNAQLSSGQCNPTLTNVTFSGNSSGAYGGAMVNDGSGSGTSSPTLTSVTFYGNSAANNGGAIFDNGGGGTSSPTLTNVTFHGNSASLGGAMYNSAVSSGNASPTLNSVILWGDSATTSGAELYHIASGSGTAVSFIYYGVIEGDCQISMSCSNTTASDPQLGTLGDNGGSTLTLMPGSAGSAVNTVPCYLTPLTDQRGAARPDPASAALPKRCDMGAVEAGSLAGDVIFIGTFGQAPRDE